MYVDFGGKSPVSNCVVAFLRSIFGGFCPILFQ